MTETNPEEELTKMVDGMNNWAKAVGAARTELIDQGYTPEQAFELVKQLMDNAKPRGLFG